MRFNYTSLFFGLQAVLNGLATCRADRPTVTLDSGVVIGTTTSLPSSAPINQFLGIPYAAPPQRFSPPKKPHRWSKPLEATQQRASCIQQFPYPKNVHHFLERVFNNPPVEESEDCLYLNIYAPSTPSKGRGRPVMFWIYGGNLECGYANSSFYDGSNFAAYEDVVIVTFNYRTNVFGFPSAPEVPSDQRNLGFLDQRLALDWVQQNIHAFGGDPSKVTIFGQSAGAFSVDALITSFPRGKQPPFRAAILQSGQYSYLLPDMIDSTPYWYSLSEALNCTSRVSNLTCLRSYPASVIKDIIEKNSLFFTPTRDGQTLVEHPIRERYDRNIAMVPVLVGNVAQEGTVNVWGANNATEFLGGVFGRFPKVLRNILAAYPPTAGLDDFHYISNIFSDWYFNCPQALHAQACVSVGIPTWKYYYNITFPNIKLPVRRDMGVWHGSEIPIIWGNYPAESATQEEQELSKSLRKAWADFAREPRNGPGWRQMRSGASGGLNHLEPDMAVLGSKGKSGIKMVKHEAIEKKCRVFQQYYEALMVKNGDIIMKR